MVAPVHMGTVVTHNSVMPCARRKSSSGRDDKLLSSINLDVQDDFFNQMWIRVRQNGMKTGEQLIHPSRR